MNRNFWGKLVIVAVIVFFILPSLSPAQMISGRINKAGEDKRYELKYCVTFSEKDLIFDKFNGYDVVQLKDGNCINDVGKPMMPTKEIKIALPAGMAVTGVQVVDTQSVVIKGRYNVFPAQPPRRTDGSDDDVAFVKPDPTIYKSTRRYPSQIVDFVHQSDLAGQVIAEILLYPLQYVPREKKLTLYTSITFVITGVGGYICDDYLPRSISENGRATYEQMIEDMVINPEDVRLMTDPKGNPPMTLDLPSGGPYSYVIIGSSSHQSYWQSLIDWRTREGYRATYVTTAYIYGNYAGADNQEKIRNFVIDARNNWGTMYFLIVGEDNNVPFEFRTYQGDSIPSDQYYGDYNDNWDYEVYVGRVTADTSTQANRFINKVLMYEKTPPMTNYILDITLLGMDLTVPPDTVTYGEQLKEMIDSYIDDPTDPPYVITKVYDSDITPPNHDVKFLDALNDGQNLVNHCDHGSTTVMCTGDRRHGWYIDNSDVDGLTNDNRMSNVYSLGCHCNELDYNDCIGEHFVIYNDYQAGVSFTGNTRSGWFYVGDPDSLSGELDKDWWYGLASQNKYRLGEILAYTKNVNPYSDDYWKYCQWTLNLLGDPFMPIWTDTPASFTVTHPSQLPTGPSVFTVHVTSGGNPVNQAYVCLWKGTEVYLTGYTNTNGDITFNPSPQTGGTMYVTVTKQNYIPYEGQATVPYHNPPYMPSNPNPANNSVDVDLNADLSWTGGDPDGNPVTYDVYFGTTNPPPKRVSNQSATTYDPGTMSVWTTYYWKIVSWDHDPPYSTHTDGPIWQFRTKDPILPEWRNQGQTTSTVQPGGSITLFAQGRDNVGLDKAILATNETGRWVNFSGENWWDINWSYCKKITIDHTKVDADLVNFPVVMSYTSSDFANHAQPDGDDFVFVDATNTTKYNHEIEYYNSASGELVAWVNIPFLSSSVDTMLYVYYGNPDCINRENVEGTWNSGYIMVNHMTGATYTALDDSTANHWDVTSSGGNPVYNQQGKVGKCVDFDGSGDYFKTADFRLSTDSSHTGSAWVYVDGNSGSRRYAFEGDSDYGISLLVWTDERFKNYAHTSSGTPVCYSSTTVNVGSPQWYYISTRADAVNDRLDIFVNGVSETNTSISGTINPETEGLNIGTYRDNNNHWMNGRIDEIRISNIARSNSWIKTEYNNMVSPSTFLTVGNEISSSGGTRYGSPMDLDSAPGQWVWTNFTWQNPEISEGTQVGWKIYYVDLGGNVVDTDIMSFEIGSFTINGYIFKNDGITPELDPIVNITNLNNKKSWIATVAPGSNFYSLVLSIGTDINVGDTLRIVAKKELPVGTYDPENYTYSVNVTNRVVTQTDVNNGGIFNYNLRLNHYCINYYPDYPYYTQQQWNYSGSAVMKMWTDFKGVGPYTQNQLQTWGLSNNTQVDKTAGLQHVDPSGMATTLAWLLRGYLPLGHTFVVGAMPGNASGLSWAMHRICWWQYTGPGALPTNGYYAKWMSVRGIHTDKRPQDGQYGGLGEWGYNVYGFWINDPDSSPSSLGANSYKTADEWTTTYYTTISDPYNTNWNGKYLTVLEPPEHDAKVNIVSPETRLATLIVPFMTTKPVKINDIDKTVLIEAIKDEESLDVVKAAIDGVTEELMPYDPDFSTTFENTIAGEPFYVKDNGGDYYIVPFNIPINRVNPSPVKSVMFERVGKENIEVVHATDEKLKVETTQIIKPIPTDRTLAVVLVEAEDGHFKEATWVINPAKYLPISQEDALKIVFEQLKNSVDIKHVGGDITIELVRRDSNPYYPEWKITIEELGVEFYVGQDGTVS